MQYWPHQDRVHTLCQSLWAQGRRSWVIGAPCGAGKSVMFMRLAEPAAQNGLRVNLYSCRVSLTQQLVELFSKRGLDFGVYANGFEKHENPAAKIQICSLQTVYSRLGNYRHPFPYADMVVVDEAHQQTGEMASKVFGKHRETGARQIGFTATPVNCGDMYDELAYCASYEELRECKAHLPAICYGPDRPDLTGLKTNSSGEFSVSDDKRINDPKTLIGSVHEHWFKYNPGQLPAIGFAPSVGHSRAFVEQFLRRGVPCAHIDAERTILVDRSVNGILISKEYPTDHQTRRAVLEGSRDGRYKIVWNRFVLREAVDMPWLYHAIVATSMGGLSTYIQSVGRVLRYWPNYDHVVIQDHGGNIDRHGMPDEERKWRLDCDNRSLHKERKKRVEQTKGDEAEPICCPKCGAYRTHGPQCFECGHMHKRSVRIIRETDGKLVRKVGRIVKHRPAKTFDDYLRSALYGGYASNQSVACAYGYAKKRAKADGVKPEGTMWVPKPGDPRWKQSVRDVYPSFVPRNCGGGVIR